MVHSASTPNHQKLSPERLHRAPTPNDVSLGCEWRALQHILFWHRRTDTVADSATTFHILLHGLLDTDIILPSRVPPVAQGAFRCWCFRAHFGGPRNGTHFVATPT